MTRPVSRPFVVGAIALTFVAGTLAGGSAAAETMEDVFVRYHSAIHAAEICTDYHLEQDGPTDPDADWIEKAQSNMGNYINGQIGSAIGAGDRLHLIERAKGETDAHIGDLGCDDPKSVMLLEIFSNELEPLLPPQ